MDVNDVIQAGAQLIDNGDDHDEEYRRGVIELATALCLPDAPSLSDARTVVGYALYGVNRPHASQS